MNTPSTEAVIVFSLAVAGFFLVAHAAGIGAAFGVFLMMWANNMNWMLDEPFDEEVDDALR